MPQDRPQKAVHIILLRQEESPNSGAWNIQADQFLHFSIEDRRPGKYAAFAAEDGNPDLWNEPDFVRLIQSEGTSINLHEKEHATLHLKLITTEATDLVRRQLGL